MTLVFFVTVEVCNSTKLLVMEYEKDGSIIRCRLL